MRLDVYQDGRLLHSVTTIGPAWDVAWVETVVAMALIPFVEGVHTPPDLERTTDDGPGVYTVKSRGRVVGRWRIRAGDRA